MLNTIHLIESDCKLFFLEHAEETCIFALKRGKGKRIPYKPPYPPRGYEEVMS